MKFTIKDYKSDLHNDWCPGCVAPSTRIVTRAGSKPIADVAVGDLVLGHDGGYHKVTEVMSHWHPAPLHRLDVQGLGETLLTEDHPVYVVRRKNAHKTNLEYSAEWSRADQVRRGDYIAYPIPSTVVEQPSISLWYERKFKDTRSKPLPDSVALNEDFLRLAGYYIAEGSTGKRELTWTFAADERDLVDDTVALVGKVFELRASVRDRSERNNTLEVAVSSSYLTEIFGRLFGEDAENKRVPEPLMLAPLETQRALLRGLWAGDGTWGPRNASYKTTSAELSHQVATLLLRQGIVPNVRGETPHGMHATAYCVTVSNAAGYNKLAAIAGTDVRPMPSRPSAVRIRDGYLYAPVRRNDVVAYEGAVHNLEVEDVHSYVTTTSTLHNCGDFGILTGVQMALAQLNLDPDKVACFSGIGCSGKTPHYVKAYGFHTLHGRVLPVATGGRLVNSDVTVLAMGGDGDGYGIGAGYFVNSGRRNLDFTYIVHNNNVYGLTKGQASPTLARGKKTKSMPEQAIQDGINPIAMAVAAGYTFIARGYALEPKYLAGMIAKAIEHKGSALVDVLQTCPTYNDLYTKEWYEGADLPEKKSRLYKLEEQGFDGKVKDVTDTAEIIMKKAAAVARSYETEPIPIGIYYRAELPTYEDGVNARIPALAEKPLVDIDTFHRDVTPLLDAMR
ncbi:MAG TPA: thiamine pyrophosphate-dependent enzyme [Candidatus Limnocylindria bacterium]|nr:thiamine pyrophosphate-dependent enzyme [Candidatus Limnocylindria bacterium]